MATEETRKGTIRIASFFWVENGKIRRLTQFVPTTFNRAIGQKVP